MPLASTSPVRPSLCFESITFSGGQQITIEENEIIVFVGTNNAGKSATLKDLRKLLVKDETSLTIKERKVRKSGNADDLHEFLEKNALRGFDKHMGAYYAGLGYKLYMDQIEFFDRRAAHYTLVDFFCSFLSTETRIQGADPAGEVALYQLPPTHPIHLLLIDKSLVKKLSSMFSQAFGQELMVLRAGGSKFPLYVGIEPEKNRMKTS